MRRILLTGAAGFIGGHLAEAFLKQGDMVIAVDDLSGGVRENLPTWLPESRDRLVVYEIDCCRYAQMAEVMMSHRPEVIVHAASCARETGSFYQPYHSAQTNMTAAMVTLELGIRYGMRKFVFFSSMSIYGAAAKVPFAETARRTPCDPYAVQKAGIEQIIEQLATVHPYQFTVLRAHNVLGPRQSLTDRYRNVAAIFCNACLRGEPLTIYGDGQQVRAFSNIFDCLPAFVRAADFDTANGQIVNCGGAEKTTVAELAQEVLSHFPEAATREILHLPARPGEVKVAYCTVEKSQELLGYTETYGWRAGVKDLAEFAKQQGPQEWKADFLPLLNESAPRPWRELQSRA